MTIVLKYRTHIEIESLYKYLKFLNLHKEKREKMFAYLVN